MLAKSATLELTPAQAELVTKAVALGQLSLALRPLASADDAALAAKDQAGADVAQRLIGLSDGFGEGGGEKKPNGPVIIRYGVSARVAVDGNSSDVQQNIRKYVQ